MRSADFFMESDPYFGGSGLPGPPSYRLDTTLLAKLRSAPLSDILDESAAEGLLDLVQDELMAFATNEDQQLNERQSANVIRTLEAVTKRLGIPAGLPFRSFSSFRAYWQRRGLTGPGSWQPRRDMVNELFDPIREQLADLEESLAGPRISEDLIENLRDPAAIREHLSRLQGSAHNDPPLAIGTAKELVESTAKTVLMERGQPVDDRANLPALVSQAERALGVHPTSMHPGPDGIKAVKSILGGLTSITTGLGELRNRGYGTGHGPKGTRTGLAPRHAHLAVNTAMTWCSFMLDTLADPAAPWRSAGQID
jgi:hypothetical protein